MVKDMRIDPLLHSPSKYSGFTPSTLAVSICTVFRLPAVGTVVWDHQMMHIGKSYSQYFYVQGVL